MAQYGAEVGPNGPLQDMATIDLLTGSADSSRDRRSQAEYTGALGGTGMGGQAEGTEPQLVNPGGQGNMG